MVQKIGTAAGTVASPDEAISLTEGSMGATENPNP